MILQRGIPPELLPQATAAYWQAFGPKLGRVMGPADRAQAFLARVMRPENAFVVLGDEGELLGLAGFKTGEGSFAGGDWPDMRAVYGLSGVLCRAPIMAMLARDTDDQDFLLDGICVIPSARGQGIGTALLHAVEDEARERGYGTVRLDVVSTNNRAQALYARQGYRVTRTERLGPFLRLAFGFSTTVTMVKAL